MSVKWQKVKLGSICVRVTSGGTPSTKHDEYYGGDIPWLRTQEVNFNRITDTEVKITEEGLKNSSAKWIPANTVVVAMYGATAGRAAIATIPLTTNQACCNLIVDDAKADHRFVYYALKNNYVELSGLAHGSAQTNLSAAVVRDFEIPDVALPVQKKIASILSAYDDLIENNQRRIAILEEMARKEFDRIIEHARGVKTIPEVIEINPVVPKPKSVKVRYVPMSSLSTSGMAVDLQDCEMRQSSTSVRFVNGDTLLARITPCLENGKTGFVNFLDEGEIACGSSEFIVLRGKTVSPYFVYCVARMERFRGCAINSMVGASGRQRVQPACFNDFVLSIPTVKELSAFDLAVKPMFDQVGVLLKLNMKLAAARDALLPKLMSGRRL